jgi:hypothetical protein
MRLALHFDPIGKTDPFHAIRIPEFRKMLLRLGMPPAREKSGEWLDSDFLRISCLSAGCKDEIVIKLSHADTIII